MTPAKPPIFKPYDLVLTPNGREARVLEVLPHNERLVEFIEGEQGQAEFRTSHLTLLQSAQTKRWKEHKL